MSDKQSFLTAAITGLSELTRLEINTIVGSYTFNKDENNKNTTIKNDDAAERMCSQINLITGDITTAMTEKFVAEYKELRDYHMQRENQGHEIVKRNMEVLQQILTVITAFNKEKEKEA
jgi:hypothetical protein